MDILPVVMDILPVVMDILPVVMDKIKGNDKCHNRTGHESPDGEQRYSSTLSLTSALDGAGGQRHGPAALLWQCPGIHCI